MKASQDFSSPACLSWTLFLCLACALPIESWADANPPAESPLIVRAAGEPTAALKLAVDELAHYLGRASGLPVRTVISPEAGKASSDAVQVFHIGTWEDLARAGIKPDAAAPKGEEVYAAELRLGDKQPMQTVISGETITATLFAVYAYLEERVGVRWYFPGDLGEHVPRGVRFPVPADTLRSAPGFTFRRFSLIPERGTDGAAAITWARRNRLNADLGDGLGLNVLWWNHTFHKLMPTRKHFDKNPDFYAERDGKRIRRQLCTSNPDVVQAVAQAIRGRLDADPSIDVVTFDPEDGGGFCECSKCRALDEPDTGLRVRGINPNALSRRLMTFYTQVAREISRTHPEVVLKSLVYNWYAQPPADRTLKAEPNMLLILAHSACHNHPLDDPKCPTNRSYHQFLKEWLERADHVGFYEYYHKDSWMSLPFAIAPALKRDLPYAHKLGVRAVQSQYASDIGPNGWIYFMAAKLLWNPDYDTDQAFREYCEKMYGKAASHVEHYHQVFEDRFISSGMHIALTGAPYYEIAQLFDSATMDTADALLAQARRAEKDAAVNRRLELLQISADYARAVAVYLREIVAAFDRLDKIPAADQQRIASLAKRIEEIRASPLGMTALGVHPERGGYGYARRLMDPKSTASSLISQIRARYAATIPEEAPWAAELARRLEESGLGLTAEDDQAGR